MSEQDKTEAEGQGPGDTGHEWDGIREWNNPLPRWWLWTFYATVVWGLLYTIAFPAWPLISSATPGLLGHSSRAEVAEEIDRFVAMNKPLEDAIVAAELTEIAGDPDLANFARNGGAAVFRTYCAQCHGSGAAGAVAYPNLLDDDWLWGGEVEDIYLTIAHGIRNEVDDDARYSEMPAFGELLEAEEISAIVDHVLSLSPEPVTTSTPEGAELFADNCASCHGDEGLGDRSVGAPNLTDAIWLYGGSWQEVEHSVYYSRFGVMPPWLNRLSEAQIRQVAVYVHGLGGGE